MTKKIIVTGANGQVGKALARIATNSNDEWLFFTKKEWDISNLEACKNIIDGTVDIVINCAAYTKVDQAEDDILLCYNINKTGVENIASCLSGNQLLIHISSDYVYHPEHSLPIMETNDLNPKGVYAKSKADADQFLLESGKNAIILRTSWVYDEQGQNFVRTMLRLMSEKDALNIINDQIGSPTYAFDIAKVIEKILNNGISDHNGVYNFSNEGFISWFDFATEIKAIANLDCHLTPIPSSEYPTKAPRPLNSRMDKSKIVSELGIQLNLWKDSLKDCINLIG